MIIVSGFYDSKIRPYETMKNIMVKSAEKLGYKTFIYDMKIKPNINEDFSTGWYMPLCEEKPHIILKALLEHKEDLAWIDVDCIIRNRFDEVLDGCDVALTLRRPADRQSLSAIFDGYLNSGVNCFRYNDSTIQFLNLWIDVVNKFTGDQESLNRLVLQYDSMTEYKTFKVKDAIVKTVPCDKYNQFYFDYMAEHSKIFHFKGKVDPVLYNGYAERIVGVKNAIS